MCEDRLVFRAWNGGKMVYFGEGSITCATKDEDTMHYGMFFPLLSEKFSMTNFDVMQCTGQSDYNSRISYEGDIAALRYTDGVETVVQICWNVRDCGFYLKALYGINSSGEREKMLVDIPNMGNFGEYVIIGNIYENPELLEERVE